MKTRKIKLLSISKRAEDHIRVVMDKLDFVKHKDPEDEKDYTQLAKKVSKVK